MFNKTTYIVCGICLLLPACTTDESQYKASNKYRPQLHYSTTANWMGGPTGSIFFEEEYHLFYQYCPDKQHGEGLLHWGHAVSKDLIHWEELETALSPDVKGEIYPGSVVIDWENNSGFGLDGEPPLVAVFTYNTKENIQSQAIAYSTDMGRSWVKYADNPVLSDANLTNFHDPKVLWDSENQQWLMLISSNEHILFYRSTDLKIWKFLSAFGHKTGAHGGAWGCPDFFPITIAETGARKWVLLSSIHDGAPNGGSGVQYFVGEFNGRRFKLDQEFAPFLQQKGDSRKAVWLDYGRDHHASVSWSDSEEKDNRHILMGWMNNWDYAADLPTQGWRGTMTLPRVMELHSTANGPRIFQFFPNEVASLRQEKTLMDISGVFKGKKVLDCSPQQLEIILKAGVAQDTSTVIGFELSNKLGELYVFGFDAKAGHYFSDRTQAGNNSFSSKFAKKLHLAPKQLDGSLISMHLIIDATSCEVITDGGLTSISEQFFPSEPFTTITFFVDGISADVQQLDVFKLKGIWGGE